MMNKKRTHTTGRIKYALFVPLAAALLIASNISCISSEKQEEISEKQESRAAEGEVFQVVEEMPEFPGGMGECMKWLGQNIKYPADAKEKGVQGRVIVQFVVEKDGTIVNAKVVRGVDPDLDAEALRVVNQSPKWKPGKQKGEAVRVKYTLPIMFRLGNDSSDSKAAEAPREAKVDENGVHQVCEEMPEFPGGMAECMKYLSKNINYPEDCKKEGIQGRVIVQFVVDKDGSIKDPTIARGVHPSLDKEALRVLSSMPNWKPGKQKGEAVKVRYTIPVMFKLQ